MWQREGEVYNDNREKVEWQSMDDDERIAAVLTFACRDDGVGRGMEKMWWQLDFTLS